MLHQMDRNAPLPPFKAASLAQRRPIVSLAAVLAVGLFGSWALRASGPPPVDIGRTQVAVAITGDAGSPGLRPGDADVTLVVFTDYRCAVCKASEPALERRLAKDPRIRVLYKDWPILGPDSVAAARLALAASYQGRYLAIHRALMQERQLDPAGLRRACAAAGLDWPRLNADLVLHASDIEARLGRNSFQALSLGLEGTPAWLIGPYLLKGQLTDHRLATQLAAARRRG